MAIGRMRSRQVPGGCGECQVWDSARHSYFLLVCWCICMCVCVCEKRSEDGILKSKEVMISRCDQDKKR